MQDTVIEPTARMGSRAMMENKGGLGDNVYTRLTSREAEVVRGGKPTEVRSLTMQTGADK